MRITIRRASRTDIPASVRIEKASFGADAWHRDEFRGYLAEPDRCIFLVAMAGGKVAGYAIVVHTLKRAEVDSIAVSPSHRGQGIATRLMGRLKRILRMHGFTTLSLSVRLNNAAAIALYRKLGFRRERRINGYYEDGAPAWRMKASYGGDVAFEAQIRK